MSDERRGRWTKDGTWYVERIDPAMRIDPRARFFRDFRGLRIAETLAEDFQAALERGDPDARTFRNALVHFGAWANEVGRPTDRGLTAPKSEATAEPAGDRQPGLGALLLSLVLVGEEWEQTMGDLEEQFRARLSEHARWFACLWYSFQVAWVIFDAVPRRLSGLVKLLPLLAFMERIVEWIARVFRS